MRDGGAAPASSGGGALHVAQVVSKETNFHEKMKRAEVTFDISVIFEKGEGAPP